MSIYTVHQPPLRKGEMHVNPERFAFVRDGFHFWAFLLGPLWMVLRRLWLVLLIYVVAMIALHGTFWALRAPVFVRGTADFLIMLLIGFEAASLRRWTLNRRRWKNLGVVVGNGLEEAERRFFIEWGKGEKPTETVASSTVAPPHMPQASTEVIGLFPEPRPQP